MIIVFLLISFINMGCFDHQKVIKLDILSPFADESAVNTHKDSILDVIYPQTEFSSYSLYSFRKVIDGIEYYGHHAIIFNPKAMLSVLEPLTDGGCSRKVTTTVLESSQQKDCIIAVNAGFFNGRTGECYGNIITDGELVNTFSGRKSLGFGIKKDGGLVIGYMFQNDLYEHQFEQLISGIGWVLRNGESYVDESFKDEKCNLNNAAQFFNVKSSRTFIGYDTKGSINIIQVDGRTSQMGINLHDAPKLLKSFSLINAINLNGGGASTFIVNKTLLNYPSNLCEVDGHEVLCAGNVSSILCVHLPEKCQNNQHCNNHGKCDHGFCKCSKEWAGKHCEQKSNPALSDCCWLSYYWIIALATTVGISIVFSIFVCNLLLMYRARYLDLAQPKERNVNDQLRSYLKNNNYHVTSSNDESDVT